MAFAKAINRVDHVTINFTVSSSVTVMSIPTILLHSISASVMVWGYNQLDTLVTDAWIREQTGGHWQYLTVLGKVLAAACVTMLLGLSGDLFPSLKGNSFFRRFQKAQRTLLMVSLPVAMLVALIYWTLLLFFPAMILPPVPGWNSEPSSSSATPPLSRVPLSIDLALHATPTIALVTEFIVVQTPYSSYDVTYIAPVLAAFAGVGYGSWAEHCARHNGEFPYPFLTESPFTIRIAIYAGATLLALSIFRGLNRLHPHRKGGVSH
ncbi:FAR-17a/AIG1-like protein [Gautieria morchelliformis]|nr:FAR-17a/AIG1-like protein [Gautieria morchelliformis]